MRDETISGINGLQIAGLALLTSTAVAVAVFFGVRRKFGRASRFSGDTTARAYAPAELVRPSRPTGTPQHFSERLIVPTPGQTGAEIAGQFENEGRNPEGV
jgi:hypothetical protein